MHAPLTRVYSRPGERELCADIYLPESAPPYPLVIWLHAGGWRFGSRRACPDLARYYAADGIAMISIDYRLSNEATFPAQAEDVEAAIGWVSAEASTYGFDTSRIGLWGASAGGHLAAYTAARSCVQAVVDCYGPIDFLLLDKHRGERSKLRAAEADSFESRLVGGPIEQLPERARAASPLSFRPQFRTPFLIVHGEDDVDVPPEQSRLLNDYLKRHGCDSTLVLVGGRGHGFIDDGGTPINEIRAFLIEKLSAGTRTDRS